VRPTPPTLSDPSWDRLVALWPEVTRNNPFQRAKLAGVASAPRDWQEFQSRVPLTTKAELVADQQAHLPYGTNLTFPIDRYTRCHQTSGTHGEPLRWLDTPESWSAMVDDWCAVFRAAGVGSGDRILFAFSFGPFIGFWLAFEAGQRLGALCVAGGGMSSALRLKVLRENACTVLCCTPTYALHLAETAAAEGIDLSTTTVRTLVVAGEPGGSLPSTRTLLRDRWGGARVFDHHGMTETGPVTYEHPERPGTLVIIPDCVHPEVIDPQTAAPLPVGSEGELVLTTLRRTGSPLLRYRTGDRVRLERENGLWILPGGILGRIDDMVVIRGVNIHPTAIDEWVRRSGDVGEYRVTEDRRGALAELGVELEADAETAARLESRLRDELALRVPVTAVPRGSLPRFELKARRWRRLG